MSNGHLIKSAHIWFLSAIVALGLLAVGATAGINRHGQNSNQNSNSNTGNTNTSQNRNANRSNRNSSNANATGGRAGMGTLNSKDHDFIMDAAMGGLMEVELGRVAAQRGTSDAVKQFGQRMVDDHSKANTELMTLAQSKGITLPTTLDDKHRNELTKMSAMTGAEFDRAYSKLMLSDHKKDVSEFEKQSTRGTDPDLKAFATQTLPTLQEHLQMAKMLPGNESKSGGNSNSNRSSNRNSNSNGNSNRP
jgi:putative membrane protein